jgi:pilus assembly protein CpaB
MARMQGLTLTRGNRGLLIVAALAGLAAAVLFVVAVNQDSGTSGTGASGSATVEAVVAAQDIAAGIPIEDNMLEVRDVPESLLVAGAYSDPASVVGTASLYAISAGEQITPTRIGEETNSDGLSRVVPMGMRGVGVAVQKETIVGGHLRIGDRVDVIGVFDPQNIDGGTAAEGIPLLQNIEVLAVDETAQEALPSAATDPEDATRNTATAGKVPEDTEAQPDATTVVLSVDPAQAVILAVAQQAGVTPWLVLRAFGDEGQIPPDRVGLDSIIGQ